MSHIWMSPVTHIYLQMNESWSEYESNHTYNWIMSYIFTYERVRSHILNVRRHVWIFYHMNESWHTYERVMSHVFTYEWVMIWFRVMSYVLMSQVIYTYIWISQTHLWMRAAMSDGITHDLHVNESRHTYEWVMSHIFTYEWVLTHLWMCAAMAELLHESATWLIHM